ncbi:MAG: hypothetical protein HY066_08345 [Betaproteobacteria bacterium]|nr:hypothetical protein [Betaproteobacteria bacterium]
MSDYTDDEITRLIGCPKTINEAPRREMKEENRHRRNDLVAVSGDGAEFDAFIRQSLDFAEDFSLGLIYRAPDGKRVTLVRFNGQHEQSPKLFGGHPHFSYHIHRATAENLNAGRLEKHPAAITGRYASFDEAIAEFMTMTNIQSWERHFPNAVPLPLFRQNGETQ